MNEDEKAMLTATAAKTDALYRALMEPSPSGEMPLIQRIHDVTVLVERSGWLTKWVIRVILTVGGLSAAISTIWANSRGMIK